MRWTTTDRESRPATQPSRDSTAAWAEQPGWIETIRAGDARAFEALFHAEYARLCTVALRYVGDAAAAEDIVQGIFIHIWEHCDRLEPRTSARLYLVTAVRNRALNHLRREEVEQRARARAVTPHAEPDPAEAAGQRVLRRALDRALGTLPERCREVFVLTRQGGMTYAEVAGVLGLSRKTVENHMNRALRLLRSELRDFLD